MKYALVATILLAGLLFADEPPPAENVNSRYKVESVELARPIDRKIPRNLRDEVEGMVGRNFDPAAAADLTRRLGSELRLIVR
ncbi:MAG: hypothetical protein Q7U75_06560, partial [Desulfobacterales bacterium]|nr:hypothetical protein [Desulfobacterales bacterium]